MELGGPLTQNGDGFYLQTPVADDYNRCGAFGTHRHRVKIGFQVLNTETADAGFTFFSNGYGTANTPTTIPISDIR